MPASDLKPEADSHGDGPRFKVYDVMGVPIIQDVASGASAIAAQYGESLPSMVDDMNTMGSSVEVKQRLGSAVENLDILAYAGLDQLKQRLPRLTVSAPKLEMEKSRDSMSDHLSAANLYTTTMTEFVASFAIVQLLLRSTDAVLSKVEATLPSLPVLGLRRSARALRRAGNRKNAKSSIANYGTRIPSSRSLMGGMLDILGVNYFLGFIGLEMVPTQRSTVKKRSTRTRRQGSESEDEEELQFKDLDFARYNSESDADFSPSELSGEDDPLEYDSQTEEPEPRFAEVAEAEVVEGDEGEEVDSVEINSEDYDSEGERI